MKLTINFFTLIILTCLSSCFLFGGKDNPSNLRYWQINIVYKNAKGENLFDPTTTGHYKIDSVSIRFLGNSGGSNMVVNTGSDGYYVADIAYVANSGKIEGVIKLNKTTYDTITLLGDAELRRVLYNKKDIPLPANIANSSNFFFTVVK
jgi:hypothetical protein